MNQSRWNAFERFNFAANNSWKEYIKEIDPSVPAARIEKLKKVWYKENIDPAFDVDYVSNGQQSAPNPQPAGQQTQSDSYSQMGFVKKALFDSENILKFGFIMTCVIHNEIATVIAFAVCILALYRQLKRPSFTKVYGQKLFVNEFAHNLVYLFGLFFVSSYRIMFYIPLIIHFWIGICEYLNLNQGVIYKTLQKYINATRAQKEDLMNMKIRIELFILPISIVLLFLQGSSIFFILFYVNFVKIKYVVNTRTQSQCSIINTKYINPLKRYPGLGFVIEKLQQFSAYMVKVK